MPKLEDTVIINNKNGLHVRPSTAIAQTALKFSSKTLLYKEDSEDVIDCKSSLDIISGFITHKEKLRLVCEGDDAQEAFTALKKAVEDIYDFDDAHPVK